MPETPLSGRHVFFWGQKLVQTDKIPPNTSVYIRNFFQHANLMNILLCISLTLYCLIGNCIPEYSLLY